MSPKITEQHRSRPAYIYVRQSTNAQVLHHQESTVRLSPRLTQTVKTLPAVR